MLRTLLATLVAVSGAVSIAAADDTLSQLPDWYGSSSAVSAADVDGYFEMSGAKLDVDGALERFAHQLTTATGDPAGNASGRYADRHTIPDAYFDGFRSDTRAPADVKIGTARQFADIGEHHMPGPIYDPNFDRAVEGGNLFLKAEIDWRDLL